MPRTPPENLNNPPANPYPLPDMACKSEVMDEALSTSEPTGKTSYALRRHKCPRCGKAFMTSGHLRRHAHTHTGEKNHPCPFPGCATRCSRQDNLQQHYKTHLASYIPRKMSQPRARRRSESFVVSDVDINTTASPQTDFYSGSSESSEYYSSPAYSPPPMSPPELVESTLSAQYTVGMPLTASPVSSASCLLRSEALDWVNPHSITDADGGFILDHCGVSDEGGAALSNYSSQFNTPSRSVSLAHPIPRARYSRSPLLGDGPSTSAPAHEVELIELQRSSCLLGQPAFRRRMQHGQISEDLPPTHRASAPQPTQSSVLLSPLDLSVYTQPPFAVFQPYPQPPHDYIQAMPRRADPAHLHYGYGYHPQFGADISFSSYPLQPVFNAQPVAHSAYIQ